MAEASAAANIADITEEILHFHCPRYADFPQVELYMDQVLTVLEQALAPFAPHGKEKLLTSTMVNNYVKQGVVSPPQKKRYNRNHLAYLLVVCVLKQFLPLSDICRLIRIQIAAYPIEQAYDYFCDVLEAALQSVFLQKEQPFVQSLNHPAPEAALVRAAAMAFANKVYLQKQVESIA